MCAAFTPSRNVGQIVNLRRIANPPALYYYPYPYFARRDDFVGQVGNLRPIVNRPSGITYKCQNRLRLAAMQGSHIG
jgi:hypothetical protein